MVVKTSLYVSLFHVSRNQDTVGLGVGEGGLEGREGQNLPTSALFRPAPVPCKLRDSKDLLVI